jgi:hypothetical protein
MTSTTEFLGQSGVWATNGNAQFVYIFRAGRKVKVGRAGDIARRVAALQGGCPHKITPVLAVGPFDSPIASSIERESHRRMRNKRAQGEWFSCSVEQATAVLVLNCMMYVSARFHIFDTPHASTIRNCIDREREARGAPASDKTRQACEEVSRLLSCFEETKMKLADSCDHP